MHIASFYRHAKLVLLLAVAAIPSACSDKFSVAAEHAAIAEGQLAAGNLEEARENIQLAISARDDVAEYYVLLGRIELQAQKLPSAFNAFSRALDLQADNLEVLQAIAELGLQTDRLTEAEEAADRILLLSPGSNRALLVKGFLALESGNLDDAKQFADDILAQNQEDEGGAILTARLEALKGNFEQAIGAVRRASQAIGETEALNATLLEIYRAQGNAEGMATTFPKIIANTGKASQYHLDYINLLFKIGNRSTALAEALEAIKASPNDGNTLASLAQLFLEYEPDPLTASQRKEMAQSGTRATRMAVARFYYDSAQFDKAEALLARLLDENFIEAQALMARIALAQGKTLKADALIASVLASDPHNPDALVARSERSLSSGKFDAAIEDANVVVSDAPQDYGGYAALANAHFAKGSKVRARQVFERGMDSLPQSKRMAARYETFLRAINDNGRVLSLYGDLASANPSSVQAWTDFARVCKEFGNRICEMKIERGLAAARTSFVIDEPPGAPRARGLFARITPDQICRSSGGVCTGG